MYDALVGATAIEHALKLANMRAIRESLERVKARRLPVLVGSAAFNRVPGLWRRVGTDGHGVDARVGVVLARKLIAR